MRNSLFIIK